MRDTQAIINMLVDLYRTIEDDDTKDVIMKHLFEKRRLYKRDDFSMMMAIVSEFVAEMAVTENDETSEQDYNTCTDTLYRCPKCFRYNTAPSGCLSCS
jgi:hypothetical protein